jgi:circadian clock protein KaiB
VQYDGWVLKLYVSGIGPMSMRARENLERLCREHIKARYRIEVIDLLQQPGLALEHEIVAVPTVVRESPVPIRKAIGDLSERIPRLFQVSF